MGNATNLLECPIELDVRGRVRRWPQSRKMLAALERDDCDIVSRKVRVRDAAGLDRHNAFLAIHSTDVAKACVRQTEQDKLPVRLEHLLTETFRHYG